MEKAARSSDRAPVPRWVAVALTACAPVIQAPAWGGEPPTDPYEAPGDAPSDAQAEAEELFQQSKKHYQAGRFVEAIALLERAYELVGAAVLQYNLARAYEGNGDLERAVAAYERYLAEEAEVKDRGAIETRIATLKRQLRERDALEQDAARAREQASQPPPKPAPSTPADEPAPDVAVTPWVIAGVGGLGIGAGVVLGVLAQGRADDAEAEPVNQTALDVLDEAQTLATAANVAFIAGGVIAALGLTWGIVDVASSTSEPTDAQRLWLTVGPGRCQLTLALD